MAAIPAAFIEPAANPDALLRPYLNLNPPLASGSPKTGLPAIISFINLLIGLTCLLLKESELSASLFFFSANFEMNSQPATPILSVCF